MSLCCWDDSIEPRDLMNKRIGGSTPRTEASSVILGRGGRPIREWIDIDASCEPTVRSSPFTLKTFLPNPSLPAPSSRCLIGDREQGGACA